MADVGQELRATSDALLEDLERLEALEREKRELPPGDERVTELARAVEEIAHRLLSQSIDQRRLVEAVDDLVEEGAPEAPTLPIAATPREIHLILADWRDAERRLREVEPGGAGAIELTQEIDRLRDEYRTAHEAARRRP